MPAIPALPERLASGWYRTTFASDRRAVLRRWLAKGHTIDRKALAAAWCVSVAMIGVDMRSVRASVAADADRAAWTESVAASCASMPPTMSDDAIEALFGIELDRAAA